jgi:hemolysin III
MELQATAVKPRLRGVLHEQGFYVSIALGIALVAAASSQRALIAALVFALSVSGLLGVSALYHRVNWNETPRRWMRRLDHSMIFVLIAGTYTPFALLVLEGTFAKVILATVWLAAIAGSIVELVLADASKWIMASICVAFGWVSVVAMPDIVDDIGVLGTVLLALGGVAYTAGAVIYATKKPNPKPTVFGYHEVFHALVLLAIALQYCVVAFFVIS